MIAMIEPVAARAGARIYQLKVVLNETRPPIWRRLQVPGNANLGWLHAVLQLAMGWTNSHLHLLRIGDQVCSDPAFELDEFEGDPPVTNENKVALEECAPRPKAVLGYEYDLGDSWHHRITIEKTLSSDLAVANVARCLDGSRACPPEDCGGTFGYDKLLRIIKSPKHKEHRSMMKWLGGRFDPDAFDLEAVNTDLGKLKWPRTTEGQLRRVIMARHRCHE